MTSIILLVILILIVIGISEASSEDYDCE
jgi:hypothetical protein